jgi:HSP20 family protein
MNIVRKQPQASTPVANDWDPFRMMREVMRWDPFREMAPLFSGDAGKMSFVPDIDIRETPEAYIFKADVPGMKEKDVTVSVTGNRLTISGKREEEKREEKDSYYMLERSSGSFTRSFTLPDGTDWDAIKADMKDGVLTIALPKKPQVQPKQIPVGKGAPEKEAAKA